MDRLVGHRNTHRATGEISRADLVGNATSGLSIPKTVAAAPFRNLRVTSISQHFLELD